MRFPRCTLGGILAPFLLAGAVSAQVEVSGTGYLHYRYQLDTGESPDGGSRSGNFDVDRSYLTVTAPLGDGLSSRVTVDIDNRDAGPALQFRLKYAWLGWRPEGSALQARFGMIPTPLIERIERLWGHRMQGQVAIDRTGYLSSSDLGLSVDGNWNDDAVSAAIGIYNGEGYDQEPGDHRKDVAARVSVRLASSDTTGATAGLQLTGYAHHGRPTGGGIRNRGLAMLSYQSRRVTLGASYAVTTDSTDGIAESTGRVVSAFGVYRIPGSRFSALARLDEVDRDTAVETSDDETVVILGGAWQWRLMIDFDLPTPASHSPLVPDGRSVNFRTEFRF
ncbi:MAG TPA: hypothetical protein PLL69_01780 [Gemmatimonadales bacterium]|nr:hypothetical protein [Gemmatimonadales bacterium]